MCSSGPRNRPMHTIRRLFLVAPLAGAFLVQSLPAAASTSETPRALCGGNKKKDVKKPTDDDGKKPANPA
jgi:hypothetical protein